MPDIVIELPAPYAKQAWVLAQPYRNKLLLCGRRWGKTTLTSRILKYRALTEEGFRGAFSAPTFKLMLETFEEFRNTLAPAIVRTSREDRRVELFNRSVIEFWSSDDPQSGRGRKYHAWVADETNRQRNLAKFIRGAVRPTLADFRGDLYILGTANGEGSEFWEFYHDCLADNKWFTAQLPTSDNPYIDPEEIAQMRQDLGPELAAQELDSQWVRIDGITPLVRKMVWDALYAEDPEGYKWMKTLAVDASVSGDTTAIVGVWQRDDIYHVDYSDIEVIEPDAATGQVNYTRLEERLLERWYTGQYATIAYDPYQLVFLAQRLKAKGVHTTEFTQNSMRMAGDGFLRQLINESRLQHPDHFMLTQHVLNATLKFTGDKFRIIKPSAGEKVDLAVALSMACWVSYQLKVSGAVQQYSPSVALQLGVPQKPVTNVPASPFVDLGRYNPWTNR